MTRRVRYLWESFWFAPSPAGSLGVCRVLFYLGLLAFYGLADFAGWGEVSRAFWQPVWLFSVLGVRPPAVATLQVVHALWLLTLVLAAVGLFTRWATVAAFAAGTYLLATPHSFGQTYHFDALVVFILLILAVARSGDAWSVDALIQTARASRRGGFEGPPPSGDYRWPIRLVWVMMAVIFFAAGASKLRHSGIEWIASDTMSIVLTRGYYHVSDADPIGPWGLALGQSALLSRTIAAATLVVEVGYPLALVSKTARAVLVPSAVLMLLGIRVFMGPTFGVFVMCNVFWVPWDRVGAFVARRVTLRRQAVLFDGACGLCRPAVGVLRRLDLFGVVDMYDCAADWPRIHQTFPGINPAMALNRMHVVEADGRVTAGFDAYRTLARVLPAGWLLMPLLYLPGARAIGTRVYDAVAARRCRDMCELASPLL